MAAGRRSRTWVRAKDTVVRAMADVVSRLDRLNEVTRRHGRPTGRGVSLDEALAQQPPDWFTRWHPAP